MSLAYVMCDTDGCLVPEDKSKPPLEVDISPYIPTLRKIGKLMKSSGLASSMCTVRSLAAGLPIRENAYINGYCGFEGGNLIYTPFGESYALAKKLFGEDEGEKRMHAIQRLAERIYNHKGEICERSNVSPELVRPLTDRKIVLTWEWIKRDRNITDSIWSVIEQYYIPDDVREMMMNNELKLILSDLAFDVSPGVTKVDAAKHMLKLTKISGDSTLGIGDRIHSDKPFMELTGYVGCPANADEELKEYVNKKGGYVSAFENGTGILDILKHSIDYWM